MLKNWYARRLKLADRSHEDSAIEQLNRQITEVLVGIRIAMAVFPFLTILGNYGILAHPLIAIFGLGAIAIQCAALVFATSRAQGLRQRPLAWVDLGWTGLVLVLCAVGAGAMARHHALDGLLPYLLALASLLGNRFRLTWFGATALLALVIGWELTPLGHTIVAQLSDVFGMVFWYGIGIVVTLALLRLANRVDEQRERAVLTERNEVERWLHDHLINIVGRVARGEVISAADRQRAGRLEVRARLRIADVRVIAPSIEGLLDTATMAAEEAGVSLIVDTSVTAVPDRPDVLRAVSLAVSCLIDNAARHGACDRVRLAVLASADRIAVTLSDRGKGYDVAATEWSPHTRRVVFEALEGLGASATPEFPPDGIGARWKLQWPA